MITEYEDTYTCEGMCFSPERVLTEIFTLESAYINSASRISLSKVGDSFYLQEVARATSVIALQCRQQIYSYFLAIKTDLTPEVFKGLSNNQRIAELEARYPTASMAIKSYCAHEVCDKNGFNKLPFMLCIRKLCHVEKWTYPIMFNLHPDTGEALDESFEFDSHALLIEIAKTDSVIGLDKTAKIIVNIEAFATAARVLVTECEDCNLSPVQDFRLDEELSCEAV